MWTLRKFNLKDSRLQAEPMKKATLIDQADRYTMCFRTIFHAPLPISFDVQDLLAPQVNLIFSRAATHPRSSIWSQRELDNEFTFFCVKIYLIVFDIRSEELEVVRALALRKFPSKCL